MASEDVYQAIKDDILTLVKKPGSEIKVNEITEAMGISRSPVRDALMRLNSESLVDVLPQRGCWVSLIDIDRVEEERFLRHSLEKSVLSYFVDASKSSDISRLLYFVSLQKEAQQAGDEAAFFKWDDEMHQCIFSTAGMQRCWQIVSRETGHYRRMRLLSFDMPGVLEKNIEQHLELISALEKKDVASALKIEGDHIFKLTFESAEIIKANPEYFRRNNNDEIDK